MLRPAKITLLTCLLMYLPGIGNSQTCQPTNVLASTPTGQFTDHGDGTVTDIKTGLMWKKCSEGQSGEDCSTGSSLTYTWKAALGKAQTINTTGGFATYTDWRVPNIKELRSITEQQCVSPMINLTVFPATSSGYYWSSSPSIGRSGGDAWYVSFGGDNGISSYFEPTNNYVRFYVRLVRSGQ